MKMVLFTVVTYIIYIMMKKIYRKWTFPLFHPLLLSPLALIGMISILHVTANQYLFDAKWLTYMLNLATVAFAIPTYKHYKLVKKHIGNILISNTIGTLVAIFTSLGLSELLHLNPQFITSILPRSITTPIAIEVSKEIGGLPTLTAAFVIITGIIGGAFGPMIIKSLSIKTPIAKGMALGMSAHGVGTSKALEYGELEGTFSTLAMIFAAWITLFWAASLIPALFNIVHIH